MLSEGRKARLAPILAALREIEGLESVGDDDFDSQEIDVWMWMKSRPAADSRFLEFDQSLRSVKAKIKSALDKLGVYWRWTDHPVVRYEYIPRCVRYYGQPEKQRLGYDQSRLGVAVIIPEPSEPVRVDPQTRLFV